MLEDDLGGSTRLEIVECPANARAHRSILAVQT
jgi:hypothetical protein